MQRFLANLAIAWNAIMANKLRAVLTALGIIFGVAAVIAMLAIGSGAQQEILEQIKLVGVNNIVVTPIVDKEEAQAEKEESNSLAKKKGTFSGGLTLDDAKSIASLKSVKSISPEIVMETNMVYKGMQRNTKLVGVEPAYFELINLTLEKGKMFTQKNLDYGEQVCIIGSGIENKFFSGQNPIGKLIKCGQHWLTVIGVLEGRNVTETSMSNLGIRDFNLDIYTPVKTVLIRYQNRSLLTRMAMQKAIYEREEEKKDKKPKNYHQLDRLTVQVKETEMLSQSAEIVARMLQRRHFNEVDFEIMIPELLLKQQQRTKDIFNIVLFVIAAISLLVGGIGIMNIMLASVLERIKEIGLRLSIGAKKRDIVLQFMFEALLISLTGGIIGIILGVSMAYSISAFAKIPTIVSPGSILISFGVAASVGLIFGITPARRASNQDPITSLRYE